MAQAARLSDAEPMSGKRAIAAMAVRVAKAELARDLALERAEKAEARALESHRAAIAVLNDDSKGMLDNLHVMGIPARDLKHMFEVETRWNERERMVKAQRERMVKALLDISQGSLEFLEDHMLVRETAATALPEEIRVKL